MSSQSRERIISAAGHLFLGGSFHRIGIAEICDTAQVNKGTFYHYFPSKQSLLLEVLQRYIDEVESEFRSIARDAAPPADRIRAVFGVPQSRNEAWKAAHGVSSGCFIGNVILELASSDPAVREIADHGLDQLIEALEPILRDFLAQEENSAIDPRAAATVLMGLIQGAQVQAKAKNDPGVFAHYADMASGMIRGAAASRGNPAA